MKYTMLIAMAAMATGCITGAPDETDVELVEPETLGLSGDIECQSEQNKNGTTETCCYEDGRLVGCYFHGVAFE